MEGRKSKGIIKEGKIEKKQEKEEGMERMERKWRKNILGKMFTQILLLGKSTHYKGRVGDEIIIFGKFPFW